MKTEEKVSMENKIKLLELMANNAAKELEIEQERIALASIITSRTGLEFDLANNSLYRLNVLSKQLNDQYNKIKSLYCKPDGMVE